MLPALRKASGYQKDSQDSYVHQRYAHGFLVAAKVTWLVATIAALGISGFGQSRAVVRGVQHQLEEGEAKEDEA